MSLNDLDSLAQSQRDMLRGTRDGRRITTRAPEPMWVCERCGNPDSDGVPLCSKCDDEQFWNGQDQMTVIKSLYTGIGFVIEVRDRETCIQAFEPDGSNCIHLSTAELKAALGIDELGCGCEEADSNLMAALARAEAAEAERDEARHWAETMQAQKFEAEAKAASHVAQIHALEEKLAKAKGDFRDQVEKRRVVEGKLERVRAELDRLDSLGWPSAPMERGAHAAAKSIRAALADPEPFAFPITPGVQFEATLNGRSETFITYVGGQENTVFYRGEAGFTTQAAFESGMWDGFRILGAGE